MNDVEKAKKALEEMASEGYEPEERTDLSEEDAKTMRGADLFFEMLKRMEEGSDV